MNPEQIFISIITSIVPVVVLYGAIRSDLATAIANALNANESATRAHARIDNLKG